MSFLRSIERLLLCLVVLAVTGCAQSSQSFVVTPADEPKPGPGLLSGPDGSFTIYQDDREEK